MDGCLEKNKLIMIHIQSQSEDKYRSKKEYIVYSFLLQEGQNGRSI